MSEALLAVPRQLLARLENDAITALFHREREFGKDAEVCKNTLADITAVQRILSPEWAAHRHGPAGPASLNNPTFIPDCSPHGAYDAQPR